MRGDREVMRPVRELCERMGVRIQPKNDRSGIGKHNNYVLMKDGEVLGQFGLKRGSVSDTKNLERRTLAQVRRQLRDAGMPC